MSAPSVPEAWSRHGYLISQQLILQNEDNATVQVIRRCLGQRKQLLGNENLPTVLRLLEQQITDQPGSLVVKATPSKQTTISLSITLFNQLQAGEKQ